MENLITFLVGLIASTVESDHIIIDSAYPCECLRKGYFSNISNSSRRTLWRAIWNTVLFKTNLCIFWQFFKLEKGQE